MAIGAGRLGFVVLDDRRQLVESPDDRRLADAHHPRQFARRHVRLRRGELRQVPNVAIDQPAGVPLPRVLFLGLGRQVDPLEDAVPVARVLDEVGVGDGHARVQQPEPRLPADRPRQVARR